MGRAIHNLHGVSGSADQEKDHYDDTNKGNERKQKPENNETRHLTIYNISLLSNCQIALLPGRQLSSFQIGIIATLAHNCTGSLKPVVFATQRGFGAGVLCPAPETPAWLFN